MVDKLFRMRRTYEAMTELGRQPSRKWLCGWMSPSSA